MRPKRFLMTGLAAALLVLAAGCKTTQSTTTTTTPEATTQASTTSTSLDTGTGTMTSSTTTPATTTTTNGTTTTVATTNADNTTTTTLPNGSTVTSSQTTTIVYPNGKVETLNGSPNSSTMASSSGTDTTTTTSATTLPPGAVVTKTTTTIKTTSTPTAVATTAAQPTTVYVNNPPPMTSSTTIYQPYRSGAARRWPNTNFLVFGERASFSNSNDALSGTLNSGNLRSDINNESGYGIGINQYLGRSNFSLEFTGSHISPRTTFTPSNTQFNPITGLRVRMTPITGALQLHMNPRSSVDFYVGGGATYVMFHPDNGFNAGNTGITSIKFKNEWGPMVNAGLGFMFSPHFGINFDAKYSWVRASTTTTFNNGTVVGNVGNSERFGLNPFLLSAGLRFGF